MIESVTFRRFKQFAQSTIPLGPGLTLLAGGNNSGKSSLLHGLAVWEFCRTAMFMEKGEDGLLEAATSKQGLGLGDDEFSPVNVPSLKHLWTNLKTQKAKDDPPEEGGYTLRISCTWKDGCDAAKRLTFGLALANDRLFIKTVESNLVKGDKIPTIAYLPPFAGIVAHEERINGAIRRRRIGEGLAGAVLRNLLLDMQDANARQRDLYRQGEDGVRKKISDADLKRLRASDPWELLLQTLREVFKAELIVSEFREEYHSYINVVVVKGTVEGYKLTRYPNYNPRDLMVEGSGFLQWLSVYTLATSPDVDVLLFDEPDAHLHPTLQHQLLDHLIELSDATSKQVLLATHSSEILRSANPDRILEIRSAGSAKYLREEHQKIGLLEGIGSDYAPRIDRVRHTKRLLFVEGKSDVAILRILSRTLGIEWPDQWVEWLSSAPQKDRQKLWTALTEECGRIIALSLRDRDDEALQSVGPSLEDKSAPGVADFYTRKWRRRYIESYLIWPQAIAEASGRSVDEVETILRDQHAVAVGESFTHSDAPHVLLDIRAKRILENFGVTAQEVAKEMPVDAIGEDIRTFLSELTLLIEPN